MTDEEFEALDLMAQALKKHSGALNGLPFTQEDVEDVASHLSALVTRERLRRITEAGKK